MLNFHYKEFDDNGQVPDKEDGAIPGVIVGISQHDGNWVYAGTASYHAGDVSYDGQAVNLSTYAVSPITTRTDEKIFDVAAYAERWYRSKANQDRFAWYAGLGHRYWNRDIRPTRTAAGDPVSGTTEIYEWWYLSLGGKRVLIDTGKVQWLLDARLTRTIHPTITVEDNAALDLGERFGGRIALPWRYRLQKTGAIIIEPYMEGWAFGRSPTAPLIVNGILTTGYEPRSETRNVGILFKLSTNY